MGFLTFHSVYVCVVLYGVCYNVIVREMCSLSGDICQNHNLLKTSNQYVIMQEEMLFSASIL